MNDTRRRKKYFNLDDQQVEAIIGTLLRVGVILSAAVVSFGAIVFFSQDHHTINSYHSFTGEPETLRNVFEIIASAFRFNGLSIIQFGILLLIATPIARVIFSLFAFAIEKDRMYVVITSIVLCVLMFSLSGG